MKNTNCKIPLSILFLLFSLPYTYSQHLPEVLAMRNLVLTDSVNHIVFQNYYDRWCDQIKEHGRGVCAWIMQGDRGEEKGEYIFVWGFDFKGTRDYYFPEADVANYPQWNAVLQSFEFNPPTETLVDSISGYTDFVVLGYQSMINPQMGEVISIRFPEIKDGKEEEFENFVVNEMNGTFQKNLEGMYTYVLKGDRGNRKDKYSVFFIFDTVDRRNTYFPDEGGDLNEIFQDDWSSVENVFTKLNSFVVDGSMDEYTDYIVIY